MSKIPLPKLVEEKGQVFVARVLGVSPAAINKALKSRREILITCHSDGTFDALELRRFPSQDHLKKGAA